ncbi:hypothetical protein N8I77_005251 [Diaporthe amygdali]|uniref:Rhodopsin domain-containing protein n=1 Tax=Phomopsis amygdali TaxID=1214568 RepID=A0AAD9SFT3_PHOAM|nr:hypothetical protein N8I77_005251 [Diaporthe amygdali]
MFPGTFAHQWNIRLRDMNNFNWRVNTNSILYGLILVLLKVAILIDWLHLFNPLRNRDAMFWTIHILVAANVIYSVCATFLWAFRCTPQRKIWDVFYQGGYCPIDVKILNVVSSVLNLVSDLAVLAVPQLIIWRLNMTRAKKASVAILFLVGIGAIVMGLCRMIWCTKILKSDDATYYVPIMGCFALGEITAGFLIIGIPPIPKLLHTLSADDSGIRSFLSRIGVLGSNGSRRKTQELGGCSDRIERPWRSAAHKKPRGAWEITENDTFDLLSVTSHAEAERYPGHDLNGNIPQNSIKRDMRVDIASERLG